MIAGKVVGNDSSNKLRTYMTFKKEYKMENYVLVDVDKHIVSNFARLRISNHILEIERGRYRNIPADKRFCTICSIPNNHVEDEVHFMCECELYKAERCILFDNIELFVPSFHVMNNVEKFTFLLGSQEIDIIKTCMDNVNTWYERRKSYRPTV